MTEPDSLRRSPLDAEHRAAGAKMAPFAGWSMPVSYTGVMEEHRAVRSTAGLFDVSHMGEVIVAGGQAEAFLQLATPNDVGKLEPGQAHYSSLLTEAGTYIDDLLIYRLAAEEFLLVINAANAEKDLEHLHAVARREFGDGADLSIRDATDSFALLALQGPRAAALLTPLADEPLDTLGYYRCRWSCVAGRKVFLARTGYTGEDGFEIFVDAEAAGGLWRELMTAGRSHSLAPAGLGARDTLRTEAAMALYGHEIDDTTTPFEARLGWTIKLDKGPFVGRDALIEAKSRGPARKLVGFEITGRGIARQGYSVFVNGASVGTVTSGTFSPTLEKAIGMAYVPSELARVGREMEIERRGRRLSAVQVKLPFYKRETT
ncbi:MAG: glycine cleavage system aminomethyltransferase GcvT [bacterium]|nr:glycine cleavage system aminomethyltransferase GcvT [bacterium]